MTATSIGEFAIIACLLFGALFSVVGAIGLVKFDNPMTRLHAPTKVGTLGVGSLLLAAVLHAWVYGDGSMHQLLIVVFLFVTAPISANFIAKVSIHHKTCETPPPPAKDKTWATLDTPE
ncbi:monovalent cation/H(+) antiporter subunit G [Thalassococcus lentus]|uniref:Monovalent cation/H(+) antiporter subunit G n=1 Tax=Thalassococcus lentus TaxID=1210524 RepID=A0ABT4XPZ0_9RHOB|nr:monovalent cation/H(+) antiporter subunit G [Thalassococcus lentus]MDA7424019.1 monovalent cation/H(+) antiporter subunit G [Thalassococcus lentus]